MAGAVPRAAPDPMWASMRMRRMSTKVAVIGAGMAGLACARALQAAGRRVRVFDKGRSVGGRLATRRVETAFGLAQFDHGAQFFTVRTPQFDEMLARVGGASVQSWEAAGRTDWRVGAPGMSALPKALAAGLDIAVSTRVARFVKEGGSWLLSAEDGNLLGAFDAVVVATPAEQAAPLLADASPMLAREAGAAITAPCWAGLFAFAQPVAAPHAVFELSGHPVLAWLARDASKPARSGLLDCWVAHAHPDWTRAHLDDAPEAVAPRLLAAMDSVVGVGATPIVLQAHRWRFAKVERPAQTAFAWDRELGLGVCGDWRVGARVEGAWISGHALGEAMAT